MNSFSKISACILAAVIAAVCFGSCNTSGCTENRNAVPLAGFFDSTNEAAIQLDSIKVNGVDAPGDTVLSAAGQRISQLYLPMRPTNKSVKWCFAYKWKRLDDPRLNDTITFDYDSEPYFASEECGAYYRYHITRMDYTRHLIDSIAIIDSLITNIDRVYINIYFRVETEEQQ